MPTLKRRTATVMCLLALWLQMLAPALALGMRSHAVDRLAPICHATAAASADRTPQHHPHGPVCDHCPLCHAVADALAGSVRPAFTRFDYPVASPLRWAAFVLPSHAQGVRRKPHPRGPPTFV